MNLRLPLYLLLHFLTQAALAESVTLFLNPATPQHTFAAGDIRAALEAREQQVEVQNIAALSDATAEKQIVIALASDPKTKAIYQALGGDDLPALGEQAFALRTTVQPNATTHWVFGGDINGAMYGALQLAETITFDDLPGKMHQDDKPHVLSRGIKFNIPLDKEAPTYFYGHGGTSHKLAIKDVWDLGFWRTWFDEMARHRYNVLSLWNPHPFTSMVDMEDEYPGIAIQGVTGLDAAGQSFRVNEMSIAEKIEFWRAVMRHGKERGFDLCLINWNVFLSTADGKHGLTHKTDNPKTKDYLSKCVIKLLETYPDLKGFGITVGERMGDLDANQKEEWAWDAYGRGLMEFAKNNPERDLIFIHRQHDGDIDHILARFAPLNELPNVRLQLSCKYSDAHAHTTATPSRWHKTKMEQGLARHGIQSWLTVRNDDFYFLHWAEPQFVREYITSFPDLDKYVCGFYIGSDGWVFAREFASKSPYYADKGALSIQRTWLMQMLWGRLAYNPATSDGLFKQHLAARFPEVPADALFEAWTSASGAIRRANEQVTGKWNLDADFWPEMWTGDRWHGKEGRHFSFEDTKNTTPFSGSRLASLRETAEGKVRNKISAWDNFQTIEGLSAKALSLLASLQPGENVELQLTLKDLTAQAQLGLYNADKFRAVIHNLQGDNAKARQAAAKAYIAWRRYTDIMDSLYRGADMQRNRSFSDWHAYDATALQHYHDLGGAGEPDWRENKE